MTNAAIPPFVVFSDVVEVFDSVDGFSGCEAFDSLEAFDSQGRRVFPSWPAVSFSLRDLFHADDPRIELRLGELAVDRLRERLLEYLEDDSLVDAPLDQLIAAARPPSPRT